MASLMEEFVSSLEMECDRYEELAVISGEKTPVIVKGDIEELQRLTDIEQDVLSEIRNIEKKRELIVKDMAVVLSKNPEDLTITNMMVFFHNQPQEQQRLKELKERIKDVAYRVKVVNKENQILLQQSIEMVEFDMTLLKSMRQAPTTANYDKNAANTGEVLPVGGFDAKQ